MFCGWLFIYAFVTSPLTNCFIPVCQDFICGMNSPIIQLIGGECGFYAALNLFHSSYMRNNANLIPIPHSLKVRGMSTRLYFSFEYFIDFHGTAEDVSGIFRCFPKDGFRKMILFKMWGVGTCRVKMSSTKMRFIVFVTFSPSLKTRNLNFSCRSRSTSTKYFTCQRNYCTASEGNKSSECICCPVSFLP